MIPEASRQDAGQFPPLRLLTVARGCREHTYTRLAERSISLFWCCCFSNLVQFVVFTPTIFIHLQVCLGLPFISTQAVNHCQSFILTTHQKPSRPFAHQ